MKTIRRCLSVLAVLAAGAAQAGSLVDVQIIDRSSGQVLETWAHRGRLYVAGTPGNRYAVSLRNQSGGRVLTVLSVDGVNAVSGQTAATQQSGYVLSPGNSTEIAGWRKNLDEVAAFYFTSIADSYAARTGREQNVGVIGVAVFREAEPPRLNKERGFEPGRLSGGSPSAAAPMQPSDAASRADVQNPRPADEKRLGTGHGERLDSHVGTTEFRRASSSPSEVITIYYDSRANLQSRGIIPRYRHQGRPDPFPGSFVPDPR